MDRYVCIHGHFYQPPRENPWLFATELQDSAYPFHDWNERIAAECYAPNAASRIAEPDGTVIKIVNNYSRISFNFGPTLLWWMEAAEKEIYESILEADKASMEQFSGHGAALAQACTHMIMPLANRRDKHTQIEWGIKDFRRRFRRDPEGMWLPETAVDLETLDSMAQLGIKFTILSPRQARRVRDINRSDGWWSVEGGRIDPSMAYLCLLPSGRTITLFFYDGPISQGIAFEGLLKSGEAYAGRLLGAFNDTRTWPQLVHVATDGETYGHHQHFGDMALAYALHYIEDRNLARITNYGEYLERHPPFRVVDIFENSSWSCIHGIERWRENCGCNSGMHPGWHQAWRRPLRQALDYLRDACIPLFEKEASRYLRDPWGARNDYVDIINDQSAKNVNAFLESHAARELSRGEKVRALQWLGAQACSMLMYTSCGWFFDDISGLETTQILKYAARMIQLMEDLQPGLSLEPEFVRLLSEAPSNVAENGARVYEMYVKPAQVDILRVGAHYVLSSLYLDYPEKTQKIYSYRVDDEVYERFTAGQLRLALGKLRIVTNLTWEEAELAFAAASFGDPNVAAGVSHFRDEHTFREMFDDVRSAFERADIPAIVRSIDRHFPSPYNYSLWHLFKDEQRRVLDEIMKSRYEEIATFYRSIYKSNYRLMNSLKSLGSPIPPDFLCAAERAVNMELREIFEGRFSIRRLEQLVADAGRWPLTIDTSGIGLAAISWLDNGMKRLVEEPENPESIPGMEEMKDALRVLHSLPAFQLDVWRSQNMYFRLKGRIGNLMSERARKGDEEAKRWIAAFRDLGAHLRIKVHERM